jgi:hypothetical protein
MMVNFAIIPRMGQYEACFCIVIVGDLRTDPGEIVQGEGGGAGGGRLVHYFIFYKVGINAG